MAAGPVTVVGKDGGGNTINLQFWSADTSNPLAVLTPMLPTGAAADGTDATGVTAPAGGVGIRGWLSGIYSKLMSGISVTGTFWQATQPVSGTVAVSNFPTTQAITGSIGNAAFGAKLQDASGAAFGTSGNPVFVSGGGSGGSVTVTNFPATQPVTGTFFQSTQPVSIASMPNTPVTGTFWQATQPISASALPLPTGAATANGVASVVTALGSPLQAGGTVTANLGTIGGAATASAQATMNTSLSAIQASLAAPVLPADRTISGALTNANDAITLTGLNGQSSIGLQLVNFPAGAAGVMEFSRDNFTTVKLGSYLSPTGIVNTSPTAAGFYRYVGISGYPQARFRRTDSAGTAMNAVLTTSVGVDGSVVVSAIPDNFLVRDHGVATAAAPTYTTGTTNPLSLDTNGNLRTIGPLPASPITGQQTLTTGAVALPSNALQNGIVITALATNTGTVYVGGSGVSATTGYPLTPGQNVSLSLANSSGAFIIGTNATDKIAFAGN